MMYLIITSIILTVLSIVFFRVTTKFYWVGILFISAILVYSTTLLGSDVVGSDIHAEIIVSRLALEGNWNPFDPASSVSASSLFLGLFAPFIATVLGLDLIWVYKIILPIFLILVPVVLYFAFSRQIGKKEAFLSSLFFMIVPVFNLEIASIAKSMLAELFFASMILIMVSSLRQSFKLVGLLICILGMVTSHYTIAFAAIIYLLGILLIKIIFDKLSLFSRGGVDYWVLVSVLVTGILSFGIYYSLTGDGLVNSTLVRIYNQFSTVVSNQLVFINADNTTGLTTAWSSKVTAYPVDPVYTPLVQVAMGADFLQSSFFGKIFRILQFLSQLMIVGGILYLPFVYKKYKFSTEFIAGIYCSIILLLCCILIQGFANTINITRFYHISLFFLAPCLVIVWSTRKTVVEYRSITSSQLKTFWSSLDKELVTFNNHKDKTVYDILRIAVFIKGIWYEDKLVGVGGLLKSFGQLFLFHMVKSEYQRKGYSRLLTIASLDYASRSNVDTVFITLFPWNSAQLASINSYGSYKYLYEDKNLKWYYIALTPRGETYAKLFRIAILVYYSPLGLPFRQIRKLLEDSRNSRFLRSIST